VTANVVRWEDVRGPQSTTLEGATIRSEVVTMSASAGEPLFEGDGTHAQQHLDTFADPLSGLVASAPAGRPEEFEELRVADPVMPDPNVVREMVAAAMQAEGVPPLDTGPAGEPPAQPATTLGMGRPDAMPAPPLGMLPQQRTWPTRAPQLMRSPWRGKALRKDAPQRQPEAGRRAGSTAKFSFAPKLPTIRGPRTSAGSAGVMLAIALMLVFALVAIAMLSSLIGSISDAFH
jgi:hypothetical protein